MARVKGDPDPVAQARVRGAAQRALPLVPTPILPAVQVVAPRCVLTAAIPAGALVRLAGVSLRSVTSGFEPEHIFAAGAGPDGAWRVRQHDGHCAWTSPNWGDLAIPPDGPAGYGGPVAWS